MYRHTTPTPLKYLTDNDPEASAKIPLIDLEREVEGVWGDYPGRREGSGWYTDLSYEGIPVGRLWGTDKAVGLLHIPLEGNNAAIYESQIQHWNAAAEIRRSKHENIPASDAFNNIINQWDHTPIVLGPLENINYPEEDAIFYTGRYDPLDPDVWCEEMQ